MNLPWDAVETFVAVLEHKSFSAAAAALGVGQPTVSRRIAHLEEAIGEALFERGRSGATPTAAAARLTEAAHQMAEWAGEFGRLAEAPDARPEGVVRLAAPPGWAYDFLAPFAGHIRARLPGVRLHLLSGVGFVDLAAGDADLAIRTRPADQRHLVGLCTLTVGAQIYGAPSYVESLGSVEHLGDLDWITWAHPFTHLEPYGYLSRTIPDFEPAFASDSLLVQCKAAQAGAGAIFLSEANAALYGLVEIPAPIPRFVRDHHLVCTRSGLRMPRVRATADLLVALLEEQAEAMGLEIARG